jgi:inorganic pyrophosphatase
MSNLDPAIRESTDALDAAGNTTAAIGKGFAIGSACLVALALFGAFVTRVSTTLTELNDPYAKEAFNVNILEPFTFAGLLLGAMLPYWFSAMTMKAVGDAAQDMLHEIEDQFKAMNEAVAYNATVQSDGERREWKPDHEKCISISTNASLRKMVAPGLLVILSPLVAGYFFGFQATNGILAGCIVSGIQIAFSASNSGGAWDNAKKLIEAEQLVLDRLDDNGEPIRVTKASPLFKDIKAAAVSGDTVGDPLKDTSGPAINILIKLSAICSLVFGSFIAQYGGLIAGGRAALAEQNSS